MAWFCNSSRSWWPWLDGIAIFTSKSLYSKNSLIQIFRDQKKFSNYRMVKINTTNSRSMLQHIQIGGTQSWKHAAHTKALLPQLLRNKLYSRAIDMITDSVRTVHVRRTKMKLFAPAAADERFVADNAVRTYSFMTRIVTHDERRCPSFFCLFFFVFKFCQWLENRRL